MINSTWHIQIWQGPSKIFQMLWFRPSWNPEYRKQCWWGTKHGWSKRPLGAVARLYDIHTARDGLKKRFRLKKLQSLNYCCVLFATSTIKLSPPHSRTIRLSIIKIVNDINREWVALKAPSTYWSKLEGSNMYWRIDDFVNECFNEIGYKTVKHDHKLRIIQWNPSCFYNFRSKNEKNNFVHLMATYKTVNHIESILWQLYCAWIWGFHLQKGLYATCINRLLHTCY